MAAFTGVILRDAVPDLASQSQGVDAVSFVAFEKFDCLLDLGILRIFS